MVTAVGRSGSSGWRRERVRRKRLRLSSTLSVVLLGVPINADFLCQTGLSLVEASSMASMTPTTSVFSSGGFHSRRGDLRLSMRVVSGSGSSVLEMFMS